MRSGPLFSPNRYSMAILFPSIHPSLLSSCRNASKRTALPEDSAIIQVTYAGDFACLLRLGGEAKRKEHGAKSKNRDFFVHRLSLTETATIV